jgi:hypothetical protein
MFEKASLGEFLADSIFRKLFLAEPRRRREQSEFQFSSF